MRPHGLLSITTFINLVAAQGKCRFGNGTLLPDVPEWNIYQPCPGDNGPMTICCAIGRTNPPWGNISLGFTQDDCLPNGLCQNRITTNDGERVTTWFVDYCTESGQSNSAGKCLNICPTASYELTAKITPCDGTANSSRWCCGDNQDCCNSNSGVVLLEQILGQVSSSVIRSSSPTTSPVPTSTPTSSQASASATPTETNRVDSGSTGLSGGAIAGIVIGAVAGLALLAAALFFARRASHKKKVENPATPVAEVPYTPAIQELPPTVKYAHVQEMPGPPPGELQGHVPAHAHKP